MTHMAQRPVENYEITAMIALTSPDTTHEGLTLFHGGRVRILDVSTAQDEDRFTLMVEEDGTRPVRQVDVVRGHKGQLQTICSCGGDKCVHTVAALFALMADN